MSSDDRSSPLARGKFMLSSRPFPETSPTLLGRLRSGGREGGWREFFRRYAPAIYRIARVRGLDTDDADDIVQQVMTSICKHIDGFSYDRDRGYFRQWVQRITENKIISDRRKHRPAACDPDYLDDRADGGRTADEIWGEQWQLQDMLFCLDELAADVSPRRLEAFRMYALEGHSAQETAAAVNMTVGWVYVTRSQLLNMLRVRMESLNGKGDA